MTRRLLLLPLALAAFATAGEPPAAGPAVEFNRDVRPILADNCFACHGPDQNKRKADLRLDTREGLFAKRQDGTPVIPGKPAESELLRRLVTDDSAERMPDPASGKRLSAAQIALIKRWIEQGAPWQGHWAYEPIRRPAVPPVERPGFVRNPIDRFILARLQAERVEPSAEADRVTLLRRLTFDLTGLPPTPEEVATYLREAGAKTQAAYEALVDRLLSSPHYGERMAVYWLDLVRFADTIGYHSDNPMPVAPYRDYVIHAFNSNKPFDRFTREQIAGDLLPEGGLEAKVGSAYNRLLQTTEEGGAQAKEYEAKYAADRVRNVASVWLGATLGCAQCHDHKFDPYTMKDFYSLAAFFADVQEAAVGRREAGMPVPDSRQAAELARLEAAVADAQKRLETDTPELAEARKTWEQSITEHAWEVLRPEALSAAPGTSLTAYADGAIRVSGKFADRDNYVIAARPKAAGITGIRLEALTDPAFPAHGPGVSDNGNFVLTEFKVATVGPDGKPVAVAVKRAAADHNQAQFHVNTAIDGKGGTGWAVLPEVGKPHTAIFELQRPLNAAAGLTVTLEFQSIYPRHNLGRFRLAVTAAAEPLADLGLPPEVRAALKVPAEKRSPAQQAAIAGHFRTVTPLLQAVRDELAGHQRARDAVLNQVPKVLITRAGPPRTVRVLPRGNWLDESGPVMAPATPPFLEGAKPPAARATRADLAEWLVSPENPLTARVFVNRLWKLFFGAGLTKSLEDFGAQGEPPSHPELLDWLAAEFRDSGWDVKHLVRLMVTSGTYRQSSQPRPELKDRDPYNRLLARQNRFRLDAEMVRDSALEVSGLLVRQVGGGSAKPYQPPGYWAALNFPPREWQNDTGPGLYRRGLYTHWQRSFPHPSLLAFDAPSREECCVERPRSNIPQQALVLLNDPTFVEAARALAVRTLREGGTDDAARLTWAFTTALSRPPTKEEAGVLRGLVKHHRDQFKADPAAARQLLGVGALPAPADLDPAEVAAWTSAARALLNLHEFVTRD